MKTLRMVYSDAVARTAAGLCSLALTTGAAAEFSVLTAEPSGPSAPAIEGGFDAIPIANELSKPGRIEVVRERRADGTVYIERETTLDHEENFVNHGSWRMFDRTGKVTAEGRYDMGKRVGPWQRWHDASTTQTVKGYPFNRFKAPFVSQATFTDGEMDGPWIIMDAESRKVMQISIEDGKRHDVAITWAPNGQVLRQETFKHGVPVGDVLELKNGAEELQRTATYLDGRQLVEKKANHQRSNNKKFVETYLAPKTVLKTRDDFWSLTFAEYEHEGEQMLHGMSRHWHPNGQLEREGEFDMGAKTGRFTHWHANGQKRVQGEYADGKQQGLWVWWHPNGQKSAIGRYNDGELVGRWRWWGEDGVLANQQNYGEEQVPVASRPELIFEF